MMLDSAVIFSQDLQIWVTFALIMGVLILYVTEKLPMEITSIGVICIMIMFFNFIPVPDGHGGNRLSVGRLLSGFANPALMTVLGLLVVGQGIVRAGILARGARILLNLFGDRPYLSVLAAFTVVTLISGVMNNVPVVIIFIPILQSIAERLNMPPSKVMMGLSFTAALGGSMTLIGSGSNLLVSGELVALGEMPLEFFEFTLPGSILALIGLIYVGAIMPRFLKSRRSLATRIMERSGKYFIIHISVSAQSKLVGTKMVNGVLPNLPEGRVRTILRGEQIINPPFHDLVLDSGDVVVVAAPRNALANAMAEDPDLLNPSPWSMPEHISTQADKSWREKEQWVLAEVMIPPGSLMACQHLYQTGFQFRNHCAVLGIQRRSYMFRSRMTDITLEPGDVLLVQGRPKDIAALRADKDVVLMAGSRENLPMAYGAQRALAIFLCVIGAIASGLVPIALAAMLGGTAMVAFNVLSVRQAARALDTRVFTTIPTTLALGMAMHETGGADLLAHVLIEPVTEIGPLAVLSGFFLLMAGLSNVVGSNASAILFTPIAVGLAYEMELPIHVLAIAVVLASNCAFATPTGYQTSLLVMGPGHYKFSDFIRAGVPLIVLLWIAFTAYVWMFL